MKVYTYWRSLATFRVRIALNLKGLKYDPVQVNLDTGVQHQPDYKNVNPQMVIPSLVLDDGSVLYQSLAITDQLFAYSIRRVPQFSVLINRRRNQLLGKRTGRSKRYGQTALHLILLLFRQRPIRRIDSHVGIRGASTLQQICPRQKSSIADTTQHVLDEVA